MWTGNAICNVFLRAYVRLRRARVLVVAFAPFAPAFGLVGCAGDETVAAYGGAGPEWQLLAQNGRAVEAPLTLTFAAGGAFIGATRCQTFRGMNAAPYPWFEAREIETTGQACPVGPEDDRSLATLQRVQIVEVAGDTLILSNEAGDEMLFKAGG